MATVFFGEWFRSNFEHSTLTMKNLKIVLLEGSKIPLQGIAETLSASVLGGSRGGFKISGTGTICAAASRWQKSRKLDELFCSGGFRFVIVRETSWCMVKVGVRLSIASPSHLRRRRVLGTPSELQLASCM